MIDWIYYIWLKYFRPIKEEIFWWHFDSLHILIIITDNKASHFLYSFKVQQIFCCYAFFSSLLINTLLNCWYFIVSLISFLQKLVFVYFFCFLQPAFGRSCLDQPWSIWHSSHLVEGLTPMNSSRSSSIIHTKKNPVSIFKTEILVGQC